MEDWVIKAADVKKLFLNTAITFSVLVLFSYTLDQLSILEVTVTRIFWAGIGLFGIAFFNLFIRLYVAKMRGCQYYYEHSLPFALLGGILSARTAGVIPLLYVGGTRLEAKDVHRLGFQSVALNQSDLSAVAQSAILINILFAGFLTFSGGTQSWFLFYLALLFETYTLLSLIPYPYSNGIHILSYNSRRWLILIVITLFLLLLTLVL